jgi:hypothetical protein
MRMRLWLKRIDERNISERLLTTLFQLLLRKWEEKEEDEEEVREHYDVDDGKIGWRHIYAQSDVN